MGVSVCVCVCVCVSDSVCKDAGSLIVIYVSAWTRGHCQDKLRMSGLISESALSKKSRYQSDQRD